jgi:hypothetical protein
MRSGREKGHHRLKTHSYEGPLTHSAPFSSEQKNALIQVRENLGVC